MPEEKLDFSKRYRVGHGTTIYKTFDTAAELNAWHDAQDTHGRYFCRLYDTQKKISVLGSAYMFFDASKRWKDETAPPERTSTLDKLRQKPAPAASKTVKAKEPER